MFAIWYLPRFGNVFIQSLLQNVLVLKAHLKKNKNEKISMKTLKLDFINAKSYIIGLQNVHVRFSFYRNQKPFCVNP
jgi:hypothetical protein